MGFSRETKENMLSGAFAGAVARMITAPLDVLKIRYQLLLAGGASELSFVRVVRDIVYNEGPLALWKGNIAATYLWVSYSIVQFASYGTFKDLGERYLMPPEMKAPSLLSSKTGTLPLSDKGDRGVGGGIWKALVLFLAGASAGVVATSATYPFDIMRTQFAIQGNERVHTSIAGFMSSTFQKQGIKGFYAGLPIGIAGVAPYMGLNFALYETVKTCSSPFYDRFKLHEPVNAGLKTLVDGITGGLAGGVSKLLVYPLDTVKKRMQLQVLTPTVGKGMQWAPSSALKKVGAAAPSELRLQYKGVGDCVAQILKNEGVGGFFRGIGPTTLKSIMSTAVTFAAFEAARDAVRRNGVFDEGP